MVSVGHAASPPGTVSPGAGTAADTAADTVAVGGNGLAVLNVSLDSQIARGAAAGQDTSATPWSASGATPPPRALHVVVKTDRDAPVGPVPLAPMPGPSHPLRFPLRLVPEALRIARPVPDATLRTRSAQDPFATRTGGLPHLPVVRNQTERPGALRRHRRSPTGSASDREHRVLNVLGKWLIRRATPSGSARRASAASWPAGASLPERIYVAPVPSTWLASTARRRCSRCAAGWSVGPPSCSTAAIALVPQKDLPTFFLRAGRAGR
jgi:hypothetical protein